MDKPLAGTHTSKTAPASAGAGATSPAPPRGLSPRLFARAGDRSLFADQATDGVHTAWGGELERLYAALGRVTLESSPRTFKLIQSSKRKISQKVIEEAGEVALEAVRHHPSGVIRESADLLYHLIVLWRRLGVEPAEIWSEMRTRADAFGIAEKLPKTLGHHGAAAQANPSTRKSHKGSQS